MWTVDTSAILGHCRQPQSLAASIKCRIWSASGIETADRKQGTLWNLEVLVRSFINMGRRSILKVLCERQIHLRFAHP